MERLRWIGHRLHGEIVMRVDPGLSLQQSSELVDHVIYHLHHDLPNLGEITVQVMAGRADRNPGDLVTSPLNPLSTQWREGRG